MQYQTGMARLDLFFDKNIPGEQLETAVTEALTSMQNSSFAYNYAKDEWDKSSEVWSKDDLADQMDAYKKMYFYMRNILSEMRPDLLNNLEAELLSLRHHQLFSQTEQSRLPQ